MPAHIHLVWPLMCPSGRSTMRDDLTMRAVIAPSEVREVETREELEHERPWLVIVWNDPVNL
ncbi:MAG: hypothetical protein M3454_04365, partial [Actinomycetota bacterium]|nr:hypothetical protein [Actinomycetota bacterium]